MVDIRFLHDDKASDIWGSGDYLLISVAQDSTKFVKKVK